jgi:hypothetical protein
MNDKANPPECVAREKEMRSSFESGLPHRVERASQIRLQNIIPAHWFAAAASECASMYIAGFFYGAISIAQAYVEALSRFLAETHKTGVKKDVPERWKRLREANVVSDAACNAAFSIFAERNDYHHLNKQVEQDFQELEKRAEECMNHLHAIESEVFAYSFDEPGKITPRKPEYWPEGGPGLVRVNLRQLW